MLTSNPRHAESGFTLLELLLVIGVAALLLIGGITTYRLVSDGNKATESTRLLLTIRQESQVMAQQQGGNYTNIAFASAPPTPDSPLVVSGVLRSGQRNSFNGDITILPAGSGDTQLSVTFGNVSQPACIKLVTAINNANEVVSITAGSTTFDAATMGTFPINAGAAANACSGATNDITWVFP